ncbi:MAG: PilZ domain-containing protein [Candidatus Omnitrophota bacterium]|jgi:c-di-GMP-binding flagellar brake protein YcgR
MKKKPEQRRMSRQFCGVPVDGKEGSVFEGLRTVDICQGGVGLISNKAIPLNEKIVVQLDLGPEEQPVLVLGEVKWVTKVRDTDYYRVGMSFCEEVDAGSQSRLKDYLKVEPSQSPK